MVQVATSERGNLADNGGCCDLFQRGAHADGALNSFLCIKQWEEAKAQPRVCARSPSMDDCSAFRPKHLREVTYAEMLGREACRLVRNMHTCGQSQEAFLRARGRRGGWRCRTGGRGVRFRVEHQGLGLPDVVWQEHDIVDVDA